MFASHDLKCGHPIQRTPEHGNLCRQLARVSPMRSAWREVKFSRINFDKLTHSDARGFFGPSPNDTR